MCGLVIIRYATAPTCQHITSGFWFLLAMMSWRVAPTTARWNFWARRVLFLVTSSSSPFLCFLLYSTVQEMFLGFLFSRCALCAREEANL